MLGREGRYLVLRKICLSNERLHRVNLITVYERAVSDVGYDHSQTGSVTTLPFPPTSMSSF